MTRISNNDLLDLIYKRLESGNVISVNNGRNTTFVYPEQLTKFPGLFFIGEDGSLRMKSGRKSVVLAYPTGPILVAIRYHEIKP